MKIKISLNTKVVDTLKPDQAARYTKAVEEMKKLNGELGRPGADKKKIRARLVKLRKVKSDMSMLSRRAKAVIEGKKKDAKFAKENPAVARLEDQFRKVHKKQMVMTKHTHHLDFTDAQKQQYKDLAKKLVDINNALVKLGHGNKSYERDLNYNPD